MLRWSRFSYEKLEKSESELITLSETNIISEKVFIDTNTLYVKYCGDPNMPILVLLHGYCGASMIFFKILKDLCTKFYVIMIDLLGMGRSSRPSFPYKTLSECEEFFVLCLEHFRKLKNLDNFTVAGHSFGGYIVSCYAIKYPSYVNRIILLSPIGIPDPPANFNYINSLNQKDWKFRWIMKFISFLWVKNITPVSLLRKLGPLSKYIMKIYGYRKLKSLESHKEIMENYLEQINLLPGSGELALIYILNPGGVAKKPLWKRLSAVKVPINFFYGDRDWVSSNGAEQTRSVNKNVVVKIIENSGHDIYWDNPEELVKKIFEAIEESSKLIDN
jgi:cardiolipin-specific phospholipase